MKDFLRCTGAGAGFLFGMGWICWMVGAVIFPSIKGGWASYFAQAGLGLLCLSAPCIAVAFCYLIGSDIVHPSNTDYTPR
jgi:hypothetical protein